ncbi:FAM186A [Symbiodinium natans]|uniref:FAM186A protein n=1 Tax=Symbiodinium natans TaxID=878477 RepID=A0A812JD60_9DINO|nr:FAM186A [Symbiodinium natans]
MDPGSEEQGDGDMTASPETLSLTELTANLAFELSERDDDGDWEIEDWSKPHVLGQLQSAPKAARCVNDGQKARLILCERFADEGASVIDLAPGVCGHFAEDGKLQLLEFDLTNSRAQKRFSLAAALKPRPAARVSLMSQLEKVTRQLGQKVLSHKMALIYVVARWSGLGDRQAAQYFSQRAVSVLRALRDDGTTEARHLLLQVEAVHSAVQGPLAPSKMDQRDFPAQ